MLIGLVILSYGCIYGFVYVKSLREEVVVLRKVVQDYSGSIDEIRQFRDSLTVTQKRLDRAEHNNNKLFMFVEPWERCLRFQYQTKCEIGKTPPDQPPCALDILKELIESLTEAMEKAQIVHWISYGTLLGALRNKTIIPWTSDVDIVVHSQEVFKQIGSKLKRTGVLEKNGFMFFYDKSYPELGRVCITDKSAKYKRWEKIVTEDSMYYNAYVYADIYEGLDVGGDKYMVKFGPPCRFNKNDIFPLTKVQLYDRMMFSPKNYTNYLTQIYGPDFMQPPPKHLISGHGAYSESCKNG